MAKSKEEDIKMIKGIEKIEKHYRDSDGYWVYLKRGYQDKTNPGCHTICEDSRSLALSKASFAIPCECSECKK